jgi:hypothetical protein
MTDFLSDLRANLQEALQKAYADEDLQKTTHAERIAQLQSEKAVFDKQYAESYQEREEKSVRIADTQAFIATRELDLQAYHDRLSTENNNFAANQKIHDDLVASINGELGVLEKALDLVQTPPFIDFLNGKMGK